MRKPKAAPAEAKPKAAPTEAKPKAAHKVPMAKAASEEADPKAQPMKRGKKDAADTSAAGKMALLVATVVPGQYISGKKTGRIMDLMGKNAVQKKKNADSVK